MGGGSGGGSTTTAQQQGTIPDELKPLIQSSVSQSQGVQQNLPISSFTGSNIEGTAGLSGLQQAALNSAGGLLGGNTAAANPFLQGAGGNFQNASDFLVAAAPTFKSAMQGWSQMPELAAQPVGLPASALAEAGQLWNTVGGDVGSSPATQAGMEAWKTSVLPTVENEMVKAGLGRSGDLLEAVGASGSQAFFPLIQQEIQNRMQSIPMLQSLADFERTGQLIPREETLNALQSGSQGFTNIGQGLVGAGQGMTDVGRAQTAAAQTRLQQAAQASQDLQTAMELGKVPRDVAQQANQAQYNDLLRLQALSEEASLGPVTNTMGSLLGSTTRGSTSSSGGALQFLGK